MSNIANNRILQIVIKACSIIVIFAAGYIGIAYFKADAGTLAVFCAFLLFWVLIPGAAVLNNIRMQAEHISTQLIRSFFTGFALNIILYYLTALIGTDILLYAVGPVLSLLWMVQALKGGAGSFLKKMRKIFVFTPASFYVFAAFVFVSSMIATQYSYISPEFSAHSMIKLDFGYHAGIINALSAGYPPADPWIDGIVIQYHFFSEMLFSIPERLFNLSSEKMLLSGTPYMITPVFSVAMYSFFREFSKRKELSGLYCLAFHFSNMFILKKFAYSWFLYHIYSNINNAGLGVACMLAALPLLKVWDADAANSKEIQTSNAKHAAPVIRRRCGSKEMLLLALFIMLMTGIKGPVAIILVGGMIGTVILGAILRRINLSAVSATVLSAISFVLIYIYVLGSQHENTTGSTIFNIGEVTDLFFIKQEILDALSGVPHSAALIVLLGIFIVFYLTAFLFPFIVGYLRELLLVITKRKDFIFSRVTVYACCMVGFLGLMLLDFSGHSQVYFGFAASALVPMIAFWFFEDLPGDKRIGVRFVRFAFAVCMIIFACTSLMYTYTTACTSRDYYLTHNEDSNRYRNVTTAEYEGLKWIRDNTDEDDLISSDRYFSVDPAEYTADNRSYNTHFSYAIYTQRRQYIEGSGFSISESYEDSSMRSKMVRNNDKLHDPAFGDRGDLARELDVDYVVVSKRFNDTGDLTNEDYKLVFSNDEMDIYEVKDAS